MERFNEDDRFGFEGRDIWRWMVGEGFCKLKTGKGVFNNRKLKQEFTKRIFFSFVKYSRSLLQMFSVRKIRVRVLNR